MKPISGSFLALSFFVVIIPWSATWAAPKTFSLDGKLYSKDSSGAPILDSQVTIKVQILNPTENCILYEESQIVNTQTTGGYFNIQVGSPVSGGTSSKRSSGDSGNSMTKVFSNSESSVSGRALTNSASCSYTPVSGDQRLARISATPSSDNVTRVFSPNVTLDSVPTALIAESAENLQGLLPNQFLQVNNSSAQLTQTNLESLFSGSAYTNLQGVLSGNYIKTSASNGANLPLLPSDPSTPAKGNIWYDSAQDQIKYSTGTATMTLGTAGPPALVESDIPTLTTAGKVSGNTITSGTIGGTTSINTSGSITTNAVSTKTITLWNAGGTKSVSFQPSASQTPATLTFVLPVDSGNIGDVLKTDGSGNLSWTAQTAGSVTSVSGAAPITISGTAAAPVVNLAKADGTTDGYLGQSDWTTFNNKQSTALASANILVGSAGGVATAQAPSGDIAMTNAGVFTVNGVKGKTVSAAPTLTGQLLRYDGTNWTPNFVAMTDLRSSVTGSNSFASSCLSNQTLTYNSVGDVMSCQNISISNSQVSGLGTAATLNAGTAANNLVQLDGSANLPAVNGSALTNLNASNISSGTLNAAQLPSTVVLNGGNSFGAASAIGNNDNFDLNIKTNNLNRMTVLAGGNVGIGTTAPATKFEVAGTIKIADGAETCTVAGNGGMIRYNTGNLEFCNGSSWQTLGISGAGLTSLGGQTGSTQTFAAGSTGTAPAIASSGNVHTLNIPLASGGTVTSGTISNADYVAFNSKLGSTLTSTNIFVGNGSNVATGVALSGDATLSNTGVMTLKNTGTAGTYYKVTTDAQGRVSSGSASLALTDLPSLADGKVWIGSATNIAAPVTMSGDLSITNAGVATVATVGTSSAVNVHNAELLANAATNNNTASTLVKRDASGDFAAGAVSSGSTVYRDSGSNTVTVQAPTTVTTSYILKYPAAQGATSQVLVNDGSGNLSWAAQTAGSVTSVSGAAPITISGTAAAPVVNLAKADGATDGYLGQSDWTTFNSKQSTALASASILVGSAGGVATAQAPTGDIAMTNAGVFTVNGVKGKTVSAAPTLTGQLLRYDGTNWTPNFVAMTDLRSSVTGSNSFASSCLSNQTLTYNSVGDVMSCQNISISNSQVSGLGTAATLNAGTAASNLVQLDGSANLPVVNGSALTNLNASNISSGTLNAAQLPATVVLNGGNSFGAISSIGNNDNFDLNIKTNNANRMTVLAGGNVGVGTTAPTGVLHVKSVLTSPSTSMLTLDATGSGAANGNATISMVNDAGNNASIIMGRTGLGAPSGNWLVLRNNYGSGGLSFQTAGNWPRLNISSVGNVGVETISPQERLDVSGGIRTGKAPTSLTTVSGAHTNSVTTITVASTTGYPTAGTLLINGEAISYTGATATTFTSCTRSVLGTTPIAFSGGESVEIYLLTAVATSTTPRMVVTSSGRIGLGTSAPVQALDVVGNIQTSGCLYYASSSLGTCVSDERIKKDVHSFDLGLGALLGINPVYFKYNGLAGFQDNAQEQLGVIAQDIEKTTPSLIKKQKVQLHAEDRDQTEIKVVDYGAFTYVIINAVKEFYHRWLNDSTVIHGELALLKNEIQAIKVKNAETMAAIEARANKAETEKELIKNYLCSKDSNAIFCK